MELGLQNKVAIVTGAARGLGQAIAQTLAEEGARLALVDVDWPALQETAKAIGSRDRVIPLQADVSEENSVRDAVEAVLQEYGRIDILVNNAGIASFPRIPEITPTEWDRVLAVNLRSVLFMSQAVFPIMKRQGVGVIVNMSSMAGKVGGLKIGPAYSASKAGIICLTISLARAGAPHGIRVNAIAPAFIESAMMPVEKKDEYVPLIPLGRMGTPADVASAVLYLVSDRASFITGEVLDVNGGALMD
jgi:NAD(P)-dependent dehydrogenase (short-subunit alcohol dehydrogenase family)